MCDFYKRVETQAKIKSECLETVARQSSCVETDMPASSSLAQRIRRDPCSSIWELKTTSTAYSHVRSMEEVQRARTRLTLEILQVFAASARRYDSGECWMEIRGERTRADSAYDYLLQQKTFMIFWSVDGCVSAFCGLDPC